MLNIDLSEETYNRLLRQASSFEDTAEDVIERLLDAVDGDDELQVQALKRRRKSRATPGSILPEGEYWRPILSIIVEAGGSAPASDVIEGLGRRLKSVLTPRDLEPLNMGEVRWRNRARFARLRMTQQGLLSKTSHRGIWEITDAGRDYLKRLREVERSA
jgi:Mrr N-terminal domain